MSQQPDVTDTSVYDEECNGHSHFTNVCLKIISVTSIRFFFFFLVFFEKKKKKLADRLASTIACTLMTLKPHMMVYVSSFIELTK